MRAKFFKCLSSRIADFEGVLEHYLKRIQVSKSSKSFSRDSCELQGLLLFAKKKVEKVNIWVYLSSNASNVQWVSNIGSLKFSVSIHPALTVAANWSTLSSVRKWVDNFSAVIRLETRRLLCDRQPSSTLIVFSSMFSDNLTFTTWNMAHLSDEKWNEICFWLHFHRSSAAAVLETSWSWFKWNFSWAFFPIHTARSSVGWVLLLLQSRRSATINREVKETNLKCFIRASSTKNSRWEWENFSI